MTQMMLMSMMGLQMMEVMRILIRKKALKKAMAVPIPMPQTGHFG